MTTSFLDFFAVIQRRQADAAGTESATAQSPSEATRSAAALTASRAKPAPRAIEQPPGGNAHVNPASTSATLDKQAQGASTARNESDFPWDEIRTASARVGPSLRALRQEQERQPHGRQETYSLEHARRLDMFPPSRPYPKQPRSKLCSEVHPQVDGGSCPFGCRSCHFCRQRTVEPKTVCSLCDGANNNYGGKGRGYWCGSCLWARMGENAEEVRARTDWVCPACRDLCNCSGANCMRVKRGWFPSGQLHAEAKNQGFRSVAHYLVLTHLSVTAAAAPLADQSRHAKVARPQPMEEPEVITRPLKRQRTLDFDPRARTEESLARVTAARLQSEVEAIMSEFCVNAGVTRKGPTGRKWQSPLEQLLANIPSSTSSRFLGILDSDLQDDGDDNIPVPHFSAREKNDNGKTLQLAGQTRNPAGTLVSAEAVNAQLDGEYYGALVPNAESMDLPLPLPAAADAAMDLELLPPRQPMSRRQPILSNLEARHGVAHCEQAVHMQGAGVDQEANASHIAGCSARAEITRFQQLAGGGTSDLDHAPHEGLFGSMKMHRSAGQGSTMQEQERNALNSIAGIVAPTMGNANPHLERRQGYQRREKESAQHRQTPVHERAQHAIRDLASTGDQRQPVGGSVGDGAARPSQGQATAQEDFGTEENNPAGGSRMMVSRAAHLEPQSVIQESPGNDGEPDQRPMHLDELGMAASVPPNTDCGISNRLPMSAPNAEGANTALSAAAAAMHADEFAWNCLCMRATNIVQGVRLLYRHHPDCPTYLGPLLGVDADILAYAKAYDASTTQLRAVLRDAEALLQDAVAISEGNVCDDEGDMPPAGALHSHAGLRAALNLLLYLARLLPDDDVRWRVERRLLGVEPLADFHRSDARARAIIIRGILELLATLHRRGLPISDAAHAASDALAQIAMDLTSALPLLNAILASRSLPIIDLQIGAWKYDAVARHRRLIDVFSELSSVYFALTQTLVAGLRSLSALAQAFGYRSAAILTPALLNALLGVEVKLPAEVQREALALVCSVLTATSSRDVSELQISAHERGVREGTRSALADLLQSHLTPALEAAVQRDYQLWGDPARSMHLSLHSADVSAAHEDAAGEGQLGGEKVEALAQCYGYLVSMHRLAWQSVEGKITQPYSCQTYWRQANSAYRHFAVFMIAHALCHAPEALPTRAQAASVIRIWLIALTDTGGRQCASYLTRVLSTNPTTRQLFINVTEEQKDVRNDASGARRAVLVESVLKKAAESLLWRPHMGIMLGDLDAVLVARRKEIEATAFEPQSAAMQWASTTSEVVLAIVQSCGMFSDSGDGISTLRHVRDPAIPQVGKLLNCVAIWALKECATLHRALQHKRETEDKKARNGSLGVLDRGEEDADVTVIELRSLGEARQRLHETTFSCIGSLFGILVAAGAPDSLDTSPELLEPLACVIDGCLKLGSGEVRATVVDLAMYEILASALVSGSLQYSSVVSPHHGAVVVPQPDHHHRLCVYVLGTLIHRVLTRSSLPHVSNERAAVNAIRLTQEIFRHPTMRADNAIYAAMSVLLWPLSSVLAPDSRSSPSIGAKEATYTLLCNVVAEHSELLPSFQPRPTETQSDGAATALRAFWSAACRDALACVAARLPLATATQRLNDAMAKFMAARNNERNALWPSTETTVAATRNVLLSNLGRPRSIGVLEQLYNRPGGLATPLLEAGYSEGSLFRAGDFPWQMANRAIKMFVAMASVKPSGDDVGTSNGPAGWEWAMAAFPALHALVAGVGAASEPLHDAYRELRAALELNVGKECLALYPIARSEGNLRPIPGGSVAQLPQEQRQPNITGPPKDYSLLELGALTPKQSVPVVVQLANVVDKSKMGVAAAVCMLRDWSAAAGRTVEVKLAAGLQQSPELAKALLQLPSSQLPLIVRFTELGIAVGPDRPGNLPRALKGTRATRLETNPDGVLAERLRSQMLNNQIVTSAALNPPADVATDLETNAGMEHQLTQPGPLAADHSAANDAAERMVEARRRLEEMGYPKQAAIEALRGVARAVPKYKQLSVVQLVQECVACMK